MSCLRATLHLSYREFKVQQNSDLFSQLIHRMSCLSIIGLRTCSTKVFDINQVVRSNRENSSLDGVKRSISQKVVKKTKPKVEKEEAQPESEHKVKIPDWFSTVMELPLYAEKEINRTNHALFKEFVEDLDIPYLPSVSTVLKETESKSQKYVLKKWKDAKTKELGGEEQFEKYKQG